MVVKFAKPFLMLVLLSIRCLDLPDLEVAIMTEQVLPQQSVVRGTGKAMACRLLPSVTQTNAEACRLTWAEDLPDTPQKPVPVLGSEKSGEV